MVKPITTLCRPETPFVVWPCNAKTRQDTNVAKQVTTMKVGGKRPRGRPRLRWTDRDNSTSLGSIQPRNDYCAKSVTHISTDVYSQTLI